MTAFALVASAGWAQQRPEAGQPLPQPRPTQSAPVVLGVACVQFRVELERRDCREAAAGNLESLRRVATRVLMGLSGSGRERQGLAILFMGALSGDAESWRRLAQALERGEGTSPDPATALAFYRRAAALGDGVASGLASVLAIQLEGTVPANAGRTAPERTPLPNSVAAAPAAQPAAPPRRRIRERLVRRVGEPRASSISARFSHFINDTARHRLIGIGCGLYALDYELERIEEVSTVRLQNGCWWNGAVSADGRLAAIGTTDGGVYLFDLADMARPVRMFEGHTRYITHLQFVNAGLELVSVADDFTARMWTVETGEEIARMETNAVSAVLPDGSLLSFAMGAGERIVEIDLRHETERRELLSCRLGASCQLSISGIQGIVFHRQSGLVLTYGAPHGGSFDQATALNAWEPATARRVRAFGPAQSSGTIVPSIGGGGRLTPGVLSIAEERGLIAGAGGIQQTQVFVWDFASGALLNQFVAHGRTVGGIIFLAGGQRLVTNGADGFLALWELADRD